MWVRLPSNIRRRALWIVDAVHDCRNNAVALRAAKVEQVAFGNVDVTTGAALDGTGAISVTCTSGTPWAAAADAGAGTGATLATRKMANGADLLDYALYSDSARTTIWGDAADASTVKISGTGNGSAQSSTIYGTVLANQTSLPSGAYADTVTVTVSY